MSFFYEIRSVDNSVLKRDGGFATQDAAKIEGRADPRRSRTLVSRTGRMLGASWWDRMRSRPRGNRLEKQTQNPSRKIAVVGEVFFLTSTL
jgi:hypothetical protein